MSSNESKMYKEYLSSSEKQMIESKREKEAKERDKAIKEYATHLYNEGKSLYLIRELIGEGFGMWMEEPDIHEYYIKDSAKGHEKSDKVS